MNHVCDDRSLASQSLLTPAHLVLAVRKFYRMRSPERVTREKGVAVYGTLILARHMGFHAAPLFQIYVTWRKHIIEFELFGNLARNESVLASSHAIIKLCQQQHVALTNYDLLTQQTNDSVQSNAALNIPCGRANFLGISQKRI